MSPVQSTTTLEADAISDALRHVLMDAFSLQLLALCAAWNVEKSPRGSYDKVFLSRARTALGAAHRAARLLRGRGTAVSLHPTDPPELPRWMFAAPIPDPAMLVSLLAQATAEFMTTLEAALDVSRAGKNDRLATRSLSQGLHAERRTYASLRELQSSLAAPPAQLHS